MSSDIKGKVGWLKDENGEIFIPKTLTSAIQNAEGTNLDNLLKNLSPSPDGKRGASTAIDITYDNTTSGITSTNVQDAIDEVFQSVSDGKVLIAEAITDKGISTSATDTFSIMASNIRNINGGSGPTYELLYTLTEGGVWKDVDYVFDNNDFGTLKAYSSNSDEPLIYNFCVNSIAIYSNYTTLGLSSENLHVNLSKTVYDSTHSKLKINLSNYFSSTERIEMYKINI